MLLANLARSTPDTDRTTELIRTCRLPILHVGVVANNTLPREELDRSGQIELTAYAV
jgi:hypothetical protein